MTQRKGEGGRLAACRWRHLDLCGLETLADCGWRGLDLVARYVRDHNRPCPGISPQITGGIAFDDPVENTTRPSTSGFLRA